LHRDIPGGCATVFRWLCPEYSTKPLPAKTKERASFKLASVQKTISASLSCHNPVSVKWIPIEVGIVSVSQERSRLTSALMKTPLYMCVFPLIFRYNSVSAGRPHGSTFSNQFKWPDRLSHSRRAGFRSVVFKKTEILLTMASVDSGVKEMDPLFISTQKPIICSGEPSSCFLSSNGQPIASHRSRSCT
jgi:hypothetical protein